MALQQGPVFAEAEVIRAAYEYFKPAVARQPIVNGADVRFDWAGLRIGLASVVAQQEHEGLVQTDLNDVAQRTAVYINPRFAPGILRAELRGLRSTK